MIILKPNAKIRAPESFDRFVSAEIPDKNGNEYLYKVVIKHMIHGPCGNLNPTNVCMTKQGNCRNHYPQTFSSTTTYGKNSYPKYRRRDDGKKIVVRGATLDNRWVVPYNSYLVAKFDCHINVEICSTIKAVIYIYIYI